MSPLRSAGADGSVHERPPPPAPQLFPNWFRQTAIVLRKDLLIEVRTGEITTTTGFFAALVAVTASVSLHSGPDSATRVAPAVIWLAVAFAAVLAVGKSWHREREEGALRGLLVAPVARSAIFTGKALSTLAFLCVVEAIVVPVVAILFSVDLTATAPALLLIALAATPGIALTGSLFGAMTVRTRARDLVLASVMFPLLLPTLLAAVAATRDLFGGASLPELLDYLMLMTVFDVVFAIGGLTMFGPLMEG
ncbi:MAG TPA: heme exporter protein CcmB [Polyangiaceae bacterium]|nr:heme exporter protein CcmB [Polyangiaceae bacterium]